MMRPLAMALIPSGLLFCFIHDIHAVRPARTASANETSGRDEHQCGVLHAISSCSAFNKELPNCVHPGKVDIDLCFTGCDVSTGAPCQGNAGGACVSSSTDTCASSSPCKADVELNQWPDFDTAVTKHLFRNNKCGGCDGDHLIGRLDDLPVFQEFAVSKGFFPSQEYLKANPGKSLCKGTYMGSGLRNFYAKRALEEQARGKVTWSDSLFGFYDTYMDKALVSPNGQDKSPDLTVGRKAIFVLGPSAAGKTFSFKNNLHTILEKNGWNETSNFYVVDGGLMRDVGKVWKEVKTLVDVMRTVAVKNKEAAITGIADAYKEIGQPGSDQFKKELLTTLLGEGRNIIYLDTAGDPRCGKGWGLGSSCPTWTKYEQFTKEKGYDVVFTAINTDRNNCEAQGSTRARDEDKVYSSAAWRDSMKAVFNLFNLARKEGNEKVFMIADNNNHQKIRDLQCQSQSHGAACRQGGLNWYSPPGPIEKNRSECGSSCYDGGKITFVCTTPSCEFDGQGQDACPTSCP